MLGMSHDAATHSPLMRSGQPHWTSPHRTSPHSSFRRHHLATGKRAHLHIQQATQQQHSSPSSPLHALLGLENGGDLSKAYRRCHIFTLNGTSVGLNLLAMVMSWQHAGSFVQAIYHAHSASLLCTCASAAHPAPYRPEHACLAPPSPLKSRLVAVLHPDVNQSKAATQRLKASALAETVTHQECVALALLCYVSHLRR